MATPADQRLLELLEKWLKSLELHIGIRRSTTTATGRFSLGRSISARAAGSSIWPCRRPLALRAQVEERIKPGDTQFSDSLELMTFLANLIGSEHIERFIPARRCRRTSATLAPRRRAAPSRHTAARHARCHRRHARNARVRRHQRAPPPVGNRPASPRTRAQGGVQPKRPPRDRSQTAC